MGDHFVLDAESTDGKTKFVLGPGILGHVFLATASGKDKTLLQIDDPETGLDTYFVNEPFSSVRKKLRCAID